LITKGPNSSKRVSGNYSCVSTAEIVFCIAPCSIPSEIILPKINISAGKGLRIEVFPKKKLVNYHPQRRWLEKIVLKGTILFAVVT